MFQFDDFIMLYQSSTLKWGIQLKPFLIEYNAFIVNINIMSATYHGATMISYSAMVIYQLLGYLRGASQVV